MWLFHIIEKYPLDRLTQHEYIDVPHVHIWFEVHDYGVTDGHYTSWVIFLTVHLPVCAGYKILT